MGNRSVTIPLIPDSSTRRMRMLFRSLVITFFLSAIGVSLHAQPITQRIETLQKKLDVALKKSTSFDESRFAAMIGCVEALDICAEIEQTDETKELLGKRRTQFQSLLKKAASVEEKVYVASTGIYNTLVLIAGVRTTGSLLQRVLKGLDQKTAALARNDSLPRYDRAAGILVQSMKALSLAVMATDMKKQHEKEIERLGSAFDADLARKLKAEDEIANAGYHLAKMFAFYTGMRYPRARDEMNRTVSVLEKGQMLSKAGAVDTFTAFFRVALLQARWLAK